MRHLMPLGFCLITLAVGNAVHQSAQATVNAYQERQAETICQVDPTRCGQTR